MLLVAVALIVPWTTRRQVYCQHICPHGAAQFLLARFKRFHIHLPHAAQRWLSRMRFAILLAGVAIAIFWLKFDLAWLEPFDGWVLKAGAIVSASIAVAGLIASLFIPQAYCRFGCPTVELLHLIKSGGRHDAITRRDWIAGGFMLLAAAAIFLPHGLTRRNTPSHEVASPNMPAFERPRFWNHVVRQASRQPRAGRRSKPQLQPS